MSESNSEEDKMEIKDQIEDDPNTYNDDCKNFFKPKTLSSNSQPRINQRNKIKENLKNLLIKEENESEEEQSKVENKNNLLKENIEEKK